MSLIMSNAVKMPRMPENMFVIMFSSMYVGMAPLVSMASVVAEEKEKNTLRVLLMSNVKSSEYLMGVGTCIAIFCMAGAVIMGVTGGYRGSGLMQYLLYMFLGILISIFLGAGIGSVSRSEMNATSLTVPVMMIFGFLPMISMFNEAVGKYSRYTYSQQVSNLISAVGTAQIKKEYIVILVLNLLVAAVLFAAAYRRFGLTDHK